MEIMPDDEAALKFYSNVRKFHLYYEIVLAALSVILNCWVMYLVLTTRNRVMRNYCWVVLISMCGDFIYTGINFITMMTVEVMGGKLVFLNMGPFEHYGHPFNMIMGCLWLGGMYTTILTLGMQFIYRYYALCKEPLPPTKFAMIYMVGLCVCFADSFSGFFIFESISEENTKMVQQHPMYSNDTPGYMIDDPSKLAQSIHTFCSQMIVVWVYAVIYYTGKRIGQKLKEADGVMTTSTRDAQKQLNRVMILQAAYPAVIVALPIIMATILAQLQFNMRWCGMYLVPSISLIPIANSLTILFLIPSFRRRILGSFKNRIFVRSVSKPFPTEQSNVFKTNTESDNHDTFEHLV
ncbi:unnamed protein product [Bursaphelenchus xylophilus]|uniref:(pine wood nematode) hypothetical protein n=1 Tax=Bursaphelenchus xylophilus TaxID=6326 RepID=A0A1I7RWU3_BURXY|nr:unnamed protein product [Bursaphelenchus xylophilus]CAG9128699.1 unnamed protein product [Bursaphelenchus xylophilus]